MWALDCWFDPSSRPYLLYILPEPPTSPSLILIFKTGLHTGLEVSTLGPWLAVPAHRRGSEHAGGLAGSPCTQTWK